jgi:hypothetical protein
MCADATLPQFTITRQWVLAGKAIFTVKNATGVHYTYRVTKGKPSEKYPTPGYFLALLTGPDNENDYTYVGMVKPLIDDGIHPLTVKLTQASKFTEDSLTVKVANFAFRVICNTQPMPAGYSIDGEGRCGRCGRLLTHPDGIANDGYRLGFGPVCWELMNG